MQGILSNIILFNFETTQNQNPFDANSAEIHSVVIKILPISCFVLFVVTDEGGHLEMVNCKQEGHEAYCFMQESL